MRIVEWIKKLFLRKKDYMLNENDLVQGEKFNERDKLAIEVAKSLYDLYKSLEKDKKQKIYFILRIKDMDISKSCRIEDIEQFIQKIKEKSTIVGFELSTSWVNGNDIIEEYNDKNKITVKISNEDTVIIDYQCEIPDVMFDDTLKNIENIIKDTSKKIAKLNIVKRHKPKREMVDFGILGKYQLNYIGYETEEEITEEQVETEKRKIMSDYNKHLDEINKKIFYEIYDQLSNTDYKIWEDEAFEKIINKEKLPNSFNDLSDEQKREILYLNDEYTYLELWEKIQETKSFWNLNNIKDDVVITNVMIDADRRNISIEFNGICNSFVAYIRLSYDNNYEIEEFNPN